MADTNETISLVAKIVAAYVGNHHVSLNEISSVISSTAQALGGVGKNVALASIPVQKEPAVPIKKSVTPSHVTCLDCGKQMKMLKRHLNKEHNTTVEDYKKKWGLPDVYPVVAPNYAKARSNMAIALGLGRKRSV